VSKAFDRSRRLLCAADYRRVFEGPQFKAGQNEVLLLARDNALHRHRLGLAIAKKHLPRAVQRNLLKRLTRERFRMLAPFEPSLDIVVLSRPGAAVAGREALRHALDQQFARLERRAKTATSNESRD
jgi:ribonuclease P protein component